MSTMIRTLVLSSHTALVAAALTFASAAHAQCTYSWPSPSFGGGCNDVANCATVDGNGDLVVGGRFVTAGGMAMARIGRWDGAAWNQLGSGMNGDVVALATLANGDVVAGGVFTTAGGITVNGIARWNGSSWSAFGTGLDAFLPFGPSVQAVLEMPNGDIIVGGLFSGVNGVAATNIARFDGSTWHPLATGLNGPVRDMALSGSDLIVVGTFVGAGGLAVNRVARWNGANWSALGSGIGFFGVSAVAVSPTTNVIYVGGSFSSAGGVPVNNIARFSGGSWLSMGAGTNGVVAALRALPNGDIMVGGAFTIAGGALRNRVARWNGSGWTGGFGVGTTSNVLDIVVAADGDVVVTGQFTLAGGNAHSRIARIHSSCAPVITSLGPGCVGSGGLNVLTVTEAPQLGGAFMAKGTGLPALAFVAAVTGLTAISLPLSVALPQALPGCTLYASPDLVDVILPSAGVVTSAIPVPVNPALAGFMLTHQYVSLEISPTLMITAVTSSNGVQMTVGTF